MINKTEAQQVPQNCHFLVILFGTLEFDGRVQRMLEVLHTLGSVTLVDLAPEHGQVSAPLIGVERYAIELPASSGTAARHIRFWTSALRVAKRVRPDVVVAEDYFTTFPAWLTSRLLGIKMVYDAHELIIPSTGRKEGLRKRFWYSLEHLVVRKADLIIAANEDRARLMADHYGLESVPEYMRNIPPMRAPEMSPEKVISMHPELVRHGEQDRIVLYQGDVSLSRGLARFLDALEHLPEAYRLVIAGDGPDLPRLRELGQHLERKGRLAFLGRVPNRTLAAITAHADLGIVTYPYDGLNNIYCAPNKVFEYAQAGLPVLTTDQPPLQRIIKNYGIGELIERRDSPESVALTISGIITSKQAYTSRLGSFLADHQWDNEASRVRAAIRSVTARTPPL